MKGCHIWGLPAETIRRVYMDWCEKRTCRVGQIFPCRVYIDQIVVTLRYEYRLFTAVIT
jgi:hypothetical protein